MKIKNCKVGMVVLDKGDKKHYEIIRILAATIDVKLGESVYFFCNPKNFRLPAKEVK
jgi:hypothetical protein